MNWLSALSARYWALLLCCVLITQPSPAGATGLAQLRFENRELVDILEHYEADGYRFIFSSDLVRTGVTFTREPPPGEAFARLQAALRQLGLTLRAARGEKRWLIVHYPIKGRRLSGRITDALSDKPLADVRIEVDGTSIYSDTEGRFDVILPGEETRVLISRPGYIREHIKPLSLKPVERAPTRLEIPLTPVASIEEVIVTASRYELKKSRPLSSHDFDADELVALPELGDDAIRAASHLPGTASIGLSARPHIRGGLQDETLVLFNNVELLDPFHLKDFQSLFSSLNPSLIKSIEVYTGGFPARYGDKMSGVMDIAPVEDLPPLGGELTLSFLTAATTGYGSFHSDKGRWVVAARRGNLDIVTDKVNPTLGEPSYSDGLAQFTWQLDADSELDFGVLVYNDDVELKDLEAETEREGELTHSRYRNTYGWLQLHREESREFYTTTTISLGSIRHKRNGFILEEEEGESTLQEDKWFRIWSLAHRYHRNLSDEMSIDVGGKLNYQIGRYKHHASIERAALAELLGLPSAVAHTSELAPEGVSGGLYGSVRLTPNPWLSLETGLRWDYQGYSDHGSSNQLSPRLSARIDLNATTRLRASLGRFYQPEAIHELPVADGVNSYQKAQYTDNLVLGLDHDFGDSGWSLRTESFYKAIHRPKRRFENLFNSLVLLPEVAPDRIEVAPSKARARGMEATVSYNPDPELNLWLSYTHASADDYIAGQWQPRTWDQTQTLASGLIWNHDAWTLSAALRWHSGWQTTSLPSEVADLAPLPIKRNRDQLPHFFSLDLRASRTWEWPGESLTVYLEITNLLNRDNVGGIDYSADELDNGGYLIVGEEEELLPLVPSLGIQWKFEALAD